MTVMEGDDMQRLWGLVVELSTQLNKNRADLAAVQQQLVTLKANSVHTNTGYALRRFNVDLSKEKFESEVERLNAALVQENNELRWDNKMNERLIKDYEACLDVVMKKFRSFSHSTQTHTLQLTRHYEDMLANSTHEEARQSLHASTSFSSTLTHLGSLVRSTLREVEGEGEDAEVDFDEEEHEGTHASSSNDTAANDTRRWIGSGGYTGKAGDAEARRADAALERKIEWERLRYENEVMKEILDMAEGKGLDVGAGKDKLSLGTPRGAATGTNAAGRKGKGNSPAVGAQQQQQQGGLGGNAMPNIPSAPFPSSSIPTSHVTPVPPPAVPSAGQRMSLHERMQQAAGSIRAATMSRYTSAASTEQSPPSILSRAAVNEAPETSSNNLSGASGASTSLPAMPPSPLPTHGASSSSPTSGPGSVLVPTPAESAPAQSDVRSAPLLSLTENTASAVPDDGHATAEVSPPSSSPLPPSGDGDSRLSGVSREEVEASETIDLDEGEQSSSDIAQTQPAGEEKEMASDGYALEGNSAWVDVGDHQPDESAKAPTAAAKEDDGDGEVDTTSTPASAAPQDEVPRDAMDLLAEGKAEEATADSAPTDGDVAAAGNTSAEQGQQSSQEGTMNLE